MTSRSPSSPTPSPNVLMVTRMPENDTHDTDDAEVRKRVMFCYDVPRGAPEKYRHFRENPIEKQHMVVFRDYLTNSPTFVHPITLEYFARLLEINYKQQFTFSQIDYYAPVPIDAFVKKTCNKVFGKSVHDAVNNVKLFRDLFRSEAPYSAIEDSPIAELEAYARELMITQIEALAQFASISNKLTCDKIANIRTVKMMFKVPDICRKNAVKHAYDT
jgi:hypothetical protein